MVIKNEKGELMGAMCKEIPFPLGALEAEATAAKEGIALARDLELREVVIEGDASMVMSALVNADQSSSSIKKLVESSRTRLKAFKKWETNHVRRYCNIAAHLLAGNACNVDDCIVWVEDTPPLITNQICKDVLSMSLGPI